MGDVKILRDLSGFVLHNSNSDVHFGGNWHYISDYSLYRIILFVYLCKAEL